ncbi:MAG: hypothetical protein AAGJ18_06520 [Bacteroidota bacterium]
MTTYIPSNFSIIAFGKDRGLQVFYQTGLEGANREKLAEYLQLDLTEMPLRKGEIVYSKVLLNNRGTIYTFFVKYHFALDVYGRKGFRAIAIGLKGKRIQNWEDAVRLASILQSLPLYEFSGVDYYLEQLKSLSTEFAAHQPILEQMPYLFPAIDQLSEIELATFIYVSLFEASQLPNLAKLYLTNAQQILADLDHPMYEIVAAEDFEQYVRSFEISLYERQAARLEHEQTSF